MASEEQLNFFLNKYYKGLVEQIDHSIYIHADCNPLELRGVDPKKIMMRNKTLRPYSEWKNKKENLGRFSWTMALYGTKAMAKEAGLSFREYWRQIIHACYLDDEDPIAKWKSIFFEIDEIKNKLNSFEIEKLRIIADGTDLIVGLGKNRKWLGGSGRNMPSFEVFISPDWRLTEGMIKFTEPLYRYGNLITNVTLEFSNGRVSKFSAEKGEDVLREMIASENADKIGEFSLTDSRFSRINKFMATTLYDENVGGKFGNTHVALGNAYKDSYSGNPSKVSKKKWAEMGYNESAVHTDIVSTLNRKVIAFLKNGEEKIIYENGKFVI